MTPCEFPHNQKLNEFCMTCGHAILAHRQDRVCSACSIVTVLDLPPGSRVLIDVPEDVPNDEAIRFLNGLRLRFPGVEFTVLADGARIRGIQRPAETGSAG